MPDQILTLIVPGPTGPAGPEGPQGPEGDITVELEALQDDVASKHADVATAHTEVLAAEANVENLEALASGHSGDAQTAKTAAEAAAASAAASALAAATEDPTKYDTPEDGVAATAVDETFYVWGDDANTFLLAYRHTADAPNYELISSSPSENSINSRFAAVNARFDDLALKLESFRVTDEVLTSIPLAANTAGQMPISINTVTGAIDIGLPLGDIGLGQTLYNALPGLEDYRVYIGPENVDIFQAARNGHLFSSFNRDTSSYHTDGVSEGDGSTFSFEPELLDAADLLAPVAGRWGMITNGQSWAVGGHARPPISLTATYEALTFGGGPKAGHPGNDYDAINTSPGTTTDKPLVEDELSQAGGETGETICSGFAKYATELLAEQMGITPAEHIPFVSAAGHGAYSITELIKSAPWYGAYRHHVQDAKALAVLAGDAYALHVIPWLQGETDAATSMTQEVYGDHLLQLIDDMIADGMADTGQSSAIHVLTYQTAARITNNPGPALAQLAITLNHPRAHFVTPTYHLPLATPDTLHLSAVGYKWLGHYFARAWFQLLQGYVPFCIRPRSAIIRGEAAAIKWRTPRPLMFDDVNLAPTQNNGFRVMGDTATVVPTDIEADGDTVTMTIPGGAAALGANPRVRYALDYQGTGLLLDGGASGTLRDTTDTIVTFNGESHPLFYVAPACELPISVLED